jgi:signal transduction histidine kinase
MGAAVPTERSGRSGWSRGWNRVAPGLAAVMALAALVVAALAVHQRPRAAIVVLAAVAGSWALGALALAVRPTGSAMSPVVAAAALAVAGAAHATPVAVAAVPVLLVVILVTTPDGRVPNRWDTAALAVSVVIGLAAAVAISWARPGPAIAPTVGEWLLLALLGVTAYLGRCRAAAPVERARLQWLGWGLVVAATVALAAFGLEAIIGVPGRPGLVAVGASVLVPAALVAGTFDAAIRVIERLLVRTIVVAGLVALVVATYLLVVIGLGHAPTSSDRQVLALSLAAAAVAALLTVPARRRLEEVANQRVYGDRRAPDEPLRTFAGRMSRAVPLDELLLQLAESLHKSLRLSGAEVWTGTDGVLDRVASVPNRPPARLHLAGDELAVVARAHVSGNAWVQVWLPDLLEGRPPGLMRVVSVSHLGQLLGLIVVERPVDGTPFGEEDDGGLAELARPLGLALHNVRLDSALQASLDELRRRNQELRDSRARIVAASDSSRRQIERNLHDGAQQHLVAMAVKIGLVRRLLDSDPTAADTLLDELRTDVQDTLGELRELAHGIYPPLLRDRGLPEALQTAANRATLPTTVVAAQIGRFPEGVETAVYFCCLEAMQNAGKHAGDGAELTVEVVLEGVGATLDNPSSGTNGSSPTGSGGSNGAASSQSNGAAANGSAAVDGSSPAASLCFSVHDDGAGFDPAVGGAGHGFVNMRDRLGAIGGTLEVTSAPGSGTTITGQIPLTEAEAEPADDPLPVA